MYKSCLATPANSLFYCRRSSKTLVRKKSLTKIFCLKDHKKATKISSDYSSHFIHKKFQGILPNSSQHQTDIKSQEQEQNLPICLKNLFFLQSNKCWLLLSLQQWLSRNNDLQGSGTSIVVLCHKILWWHREGLISTTDLDNWPNTNEDLGLKKFPHCLWGRDVAFFFFFFFLCCFPLVCPPRRCWRPCQYEPEIIGAGRTIASVFWPLFSSSCPMPNAERRTEDQRLWKCGLCLSGFTGAGGRAGRRDLSSRARPGRGHMCFFWCAPAPMPDGQVMHCYSSQENRLSSAYFSGPAFCLLTNGVCRGAWPLVVLFRGWRRARGWREKRWGQRGMTGQRAVGRRTLRRMARSLPGDDNGPMTRDEKEKVGSPRGERRRRRRRRQALRERERGKLFGG